METWRQRWKRIRETHFRSFWDVLAWVAFAYMVIYAILKVTGVLNSPVEVDVALIVSAAYFVGRYAQKIETIEQRLSNHDNRLVRIKAKLA